MDSSFLFVIVNKGYSFTISQPIENTIYRGEEKIFATAKILVLGQRTAQCPFMMHYNILCNGVKDFIPQCVDQEFCTADKFFQHGIVIIRNGGIIRPVPAFCPADII